MDEDLELNTAKAPEKNADELEIDELDAISGGMGPTIPPPVDED